MLHKLSIKNYAIIEGLEIAFGGRMNIITGETGAGKSILLGALSLILGERSDTKVLYNKNEKCVVEADFELRDTALKEFFEAHELDFETPVIIRREINQSGKSRAFVNDTPVTLNVLRDLGEKLVNLHSQHETLDLVKSGFQLQIIDAIAGNQPLLDTFRQKFFKYKKDLKYLEDLTAQWNSSSAELDYLQFQLKELAEARLESKEQLLLEAEQNILSNVEEIKFSLQGAVQILSENEFALLDQLNDILTKLKNVKAYNKDISALNNRLLTVYEEVKDISGELENLQENTLLDPQRLEEIHNRLNIIYSLQKKHSAASVDDLIKFQHQLEDRIFSVDTSSGKIESLKADLEKLHKELSALAAQLHQCREKVLRHFQTHVTVLLAKVGMPNASFKVEVAKLNELNENGFSEIKFLFSANKGFSPGEIKDIASGGELSRLMLCIKSLAADALALPTLIFDEIDAGISGEVALKTGEIMKKISRNHQLICITHLPQIARTGDVHFYIYKENKEGRTQTRFKELKGEERVIELAKMLSGDKISEAALANAREMIAG